MANAHAYAIHIEAILRNLFHCDRGGMAGIIDANFIQRNLYAGVTAGLGYLYATANDDKKQEIGNFISDFGFYLNLGLGTLLEFTANEKVIDGCTYTLDYENGEKAIDAMISAFSKICK